MAKTRRVPRLIFEGGGSYMKSKDINIMPREDDRQNTTEQNQTAIKKNKKREEFLFFQKIRR